MKNENDPGERPDLREQLNQAVKSIYQQKSKSQERTPYQANVPIGPYAKTVLYLAGAFVVVWASQFALAALAGVVRQYKNLKKAFKE